MSMFHLWLAPTGTAYERLAGIIAEFSVRYRGPQFDPHLTLLGKLEGKQEFLIARTQQLAYELQPFEVRLDAPGYESHYFRCLYLPAEPSPSLLEAHRQATQIFDHRSTSAFNPHVSLLYGVFSESVKREIINALSPDLPGTVLLSRLQLIRAGSTNPQDWEVVEALDF